MKETNSNIRMLSALMLRLLPTQILLAAVGSVNGIVSSFFASRYVGIAAMSAVGLYSPVGMLLQAVATMLMGGSVILCGKYMGQNRQEKLQSVFSLDMVLSALLAGGFSLLFALLAAFDLTGFFTRDTAVRPLFNRYVLGQAIGIFPLLLGNQLSAFLSMENRQRRTMAASLIYIAVNLMLNALFVQALRLEAFGLALASSLGMWVFLAVQAGYFLSGRSHLRLRLRKLPWGDIRDIVRVGGPGALSNGYQTSRGLIVNWLLEAYVGTVGISAFAAANNLLAVFWSLPVGMLAVSRMMISVSIGEEDRQTLADVMRVMLRRYIPLMYAVAALLIAFAAPLTGIFYRDPAEPVFRMTLWGIRILPLCMPLSILYMHYVCYCQASGRRRMVRVLSLLDGTADVAVFTALLIPVLGVNSVYIANVLNGVVTTLVILGWSAWKNKRFPRNMEDVLVFPADFGAAEDRRLDLTVRSVEQVVSIARQVQSFCLERGIDPRRAYLSGLALEEMAGNIVEHGFTKDRKSHSVDVRVVCKGDEVILRLKDDCAPFDPGERQRLADGDDVTRNIGLRMVFKTARDVQYQNILGLNVLSIRL